MVLIQFGGTSNGIVHEYNGNYMDMMAESSINNIMYKGLILIGSASYIILIVSVDECESTLV